MLLPLFEGLVKTTHFDAEMAQLADRHYSRRTVGARQFAYSGRKLVLRDVSGLVLFVWMYPRPELRMDDRAGYHCTIFRNESPRLSSDIILEAEQAAVDKWGQNTAWTFVDARKIKSPNPGYCFKKAGWRSAGVTKSGLHVLTKFL